MQVFINLATNEKNMEMFGDTGGFPPLVKLLYHPVFSMDAMPFLITLLSNRTPLLLLRVLFRPQHADFSTPIRRTVARRAGQFVAAEGLRPLFDFVSRAPGQHEGKLDNSLEHCLLALHNLIGNRTFSPTYMGRFQFRS
jgi:hypothetical protein